MKKAKKVGVANPAVPCGPCGQQILGSNSDKIARFLKNVTLELEKWWLGM